jgi:hypothetical protein
MTRSVRIPLPHGLFAVIDSADAALVREYSWHLKTQTARPEHIYAQTSMRLPGGRKKSVLLHRMLMDARQGEVVDHVNGDTLDCRRKNLRLATARGNSTNVTSSKNQKLGGYKGVSWNKNAGKWEAGICAGEVKANGKRRRIYLGLFESEREAAGAYDSAARHAYGEFASTNFP